MSNESGMEFETSKKDKSVEGKNYQNVSTDLNFCWKEPTLNSQTVSEVRRMFLY